MCAREVIRRRNTLRGNEGTIRASAHGNVLYRHMFNFHRAAQHVNACTVLGFDSVGNVAVDILDRQIDLRARIAHAQAVDDGADKRLYFFIALEAVISELKRHAAFGGTALNAVHPYKPFSFLSKFRRLTAVKHADEVVRDQNRIQKLSL